MAGVDRDPNKAESLNYRPLIHPLAQNDADVVIEKDKQYGASWCKRGGTGAYHVFIRKFDRLEEFAKKFDYDIFRAIVVDSRPEGIIDDIRDIRGYLLLVEAYAIENGLVKPRFQPVEPRCEARMNGFICGRKLGHDGLHRGTDFEATFNWDGSPEEATLNMNMNIGRGTRGELDEIDP